MLPLCVGVLQPGVDLVAPLETNKRGRTESGKSIPSNPLVKVYRGSARAECRARGAFALRCYTLATAGSGTYGMA